MRTPIKVHKASSVVTTLHTFIDNQREALDCHAQYLAGHLSLHQAITAIEFLRMSHLFDVDIHGQLIQTVFPSNATGH